MDPLKLSKREQKENEKKQNRRKMDLKPFQLCQAVSKLTNVRNERDGHKVDAGDLPAQV